MVLFVVYEGDFVIGSQCVDVGLVLSGVIEPVPVIPPLLSVVVSLSALNVDLFVEWLIIVDVVSALITFRQVIQSLTGRVSLLLIIVPVIA